MLIINRFVTMSPEQYDIVIEGMRNAKNSWDRSDSHTTFIVDPETMEMADFEFFIGDNDLKLMNELADGGPVHAKYRRMMPVWIDITAPLYWWKEFDTYKVGTVSNSCSTMHKIHAKEFTIDDFSHDHLGVTVPAEFAVDSEEPLFQNLWLAELENTIDALNIARGYFLREKDKNLKKDYWWQMIQLLPSSYNQKRTIKLNYEVLTNIYKWRKNHKLTEWHTFCDWIEQLPYSELITGEKNG